MTMPLFISSVRRFLTLTVMKTFFIGVLVAAALTRTGNAQLPSTEPPKTWIVLGGAFINLANIAKIEIPAGAEPLFYGPTSKTKLLSLNKGSDLMQLRLYIGRSPEWVTVPDKREPTREIYVNLNHV